MAVSDNELRLLISARDNANKIVQAAAGHIQTVIKAVDQLGKARGFNDAAKSAQAAGTAMQQATQKMAAGVTQVNALSTATKTLGTTVQQSARTAAQGYAQIGAAAQQAARAAQQAAASVNSSARASGNAARGGGNTPTVNAGPTQQSLGMIAAAFRTAQQQAASASQGIAQSLMAIGNAARGVAGGVAGGLSAAFNGLRSIVGSLSGAAGSISGLARSAGELGAASGHVRSFDVSLRSMLATAGAIVGLQSAIGLLSQGFQAFQGAAIGFNSQLENARIAFTSLLGDGQKALAFMGQLRTMAESTSFEFPELLKLSQGLIGVGVQAENVIPLLKDVAGAMVAAGRTSADVAGVGRALQQIFTTGRVQADEMNQLAERGIPGWRILGESIRGAGESIESAIARARKLGEQGKISANDFFNAFQAYSKEAGWRGMAESAVASFTGAMSNLKDSMRFLVSDATEPLFQSLSMGLQGLSKFLQSDDIRQFALDIGATLKDVIAGLAPVQEAFTKAFDFSQSSGSSTAKAAIDGIVAAFSAIGQEMFGAGYALMGTYAEGIMSGASDLIQGAVDAVAQLIADYLIGNSPPAQGPLSAIDQGGMNVGMAWVEGLARGFQGVDSVVQGVSQSFANLNTSIQLVDAANNFEDAKGSLEGMKAAAEQVEDVLRELGAAQRELDAEQGNVKNQVDTIKDSYGTQIDDLQRMVDIIKDQNTEAEKHADLIQKQNDAISEQADLRDRAALNELKAAEIAAEGDPVKRAALQAEAARLKFQEQELQLAQKERDISRRIQEQEEKRAKAKKDGKDFDEKDFQIEQRRIELDRAQLANQRAIYGLADNETLARIEGERALIQYNQAVREVAEDRLRMETAAVKNAAEIERAQREILALPLEQQIEALQRSQEDALRPLEARLNVLQREERQLQAIRAEWQGLKGDITDAIGDQKDADKAAKAGAAGKGFAGGALNLDRQEIDVAAASQRVGKSLADGIGASMQANLPVVLTGALGAVLGGAAFGPLGFIAGGLFASQVGAGVQARLPELNTILGDVGRTFQQALAGEWSTSHGGEWVSPIVDAAGRVGLAMRSAAEGIREAWRAAERPISNILKVLRENMGTVAAAATGLLVPAVTGAAATILRVFGPLAAVFARLSPAMLLVSAAAVALKVAWDKNFGGMQQTIAAAMPKVQSALKTLHATLLLLLEGDWGTALVGLQVALSELGAALGPIIAGWGESFRAWLPTAQAALQEGLATIWAWITAQAPGFVTQLAAWGVAFVDWVAPMIPPMLTALGGVITAVVEWLVAQGPAILAQLQIWGTQFVEWIGPMIPPMMAALGEAIATVWAWITAQAPGFLAQLATWAVAFVDWVAPMVPPMLAALGEVLQQVWAWIQQQGPGILTQLGIWAEQFILWIAPAAARLPAALVEINVALIGWILDNIEPIAANLAKWAVLFGAWVVDAMAQMLAALAKGALELAPKISAAAENIGVAIVAGIVAGIQALWPDVFNTINSNINDIWKKLTGMPGQKSIDASGTYQQQALQASSKYGLDPKKFIAQLELESGFNPNAESKAGARGIGQFMPGTAIDIAKKLGVTVEELLSSATLQIEGAAMHMRELIDKHGSYDLALAAYNAGSGAVQRHGGIPPYKETQDYIRIINSNAPGVQLPSLPGGTTTPRGGGGPVPMPSASGIGVSQGSPGPGLDVIRQTQREWAKNAADAGVICGPYLAALFSDAVGRPPTPEEARQIAASMPTGNIYTGQINNASLYDEYATRVIQTMNPGTSVSVAQQPVANAAQASFLAQQSLAEGKPLVGFNTPNHYFGATAYDPATKKFNTGGTGRSIGGEDWMTAERIAELGGGITNVITLVGQMGEKFAVAGQMASGGMVPVEQATVATEVSAKNLTESLTAGLAPAGATAGTSLQQMTASIDPLLQQIAAGSMTTDQMVTELARLAETTGLTDAPLRNMTTGSKDASLAMLSMFSAAAQTDPAFAALQEQMLATDADAKTMAVTFAQGVANSTGAAGAAITQMQGVITPLTGMLAAGAATGEEMSLAVVDLAAKTGLATGPMRQLQDGVLTTDEALAQVIEHARNVSPEFAALADGVKESGGATAETAVKFLELVKAFAGVQKPAEEAATATDEMVTSTEAVVPAAQNVAAQLPPAAAEGAAGFRSEIVNGAKRTIEELKELEGAAREAGEAIGKAFAEGILDELEARKDDIKKKAEEIADLGKSKGKGGGGDDEEDGDDEGDGESDRATDAVARALSSMARAADAHSPSNKTKELGKNLNDGLEIGQKENASKVADAGGSVMDGALEAMRQAADAHSPSREAQSIAGDVMDGLELEFAGRDMEALGRDAVAGFLRGASAAGDAMASGAAKGVESLQHLIALEENKLLPITQRIKEIQDQINQAQKGTIEQQRELANIGLQRAEVQRHIAAKELENFQVNKQLAALQDQAARTAKGDLESRIRVAQISQQQASVAYEIGLREAETLEDRLQLERIEAKQAQVRKGTLADRQREAEIATRQSQITLQQLTTEQALLPMRNRMRDIQQSIEDAERGSLAVQMQKLAAETASQKNKLSQLKIEDQIANAESLGLSQEEINALFDQRTGLQKEDENAARRAEIASLETKVAQEPARAELLGLQEAERQATRALQPGQDEAAAMEAELAVTKERNNLAAMYWEQERVLADDRATRNDEDILYLQQRGERLASEVELIDLANQRSAAGFAVQLVIEEELARVRQEEIAAYQSQLEYLGLLEAYKRSILDVDVAGLQLILIEEEERYRIASATLVQLQKQLEIEQALANTQKDSGKGGKEGGKKKKSVDVDTHDILSATSGIRTLDRSLDRVERDQTRIPLRSADIMYALGKTYALQDSLGSVGDIYAAPQVEDLDIQQTTERTTSLYDMLRTVGATSTVTQVDYSQVDSARGIADAVRARLVEINSQRTVPPVDPGQITDTWGVAGNLQERLADVRNRGNIVPVDPGRITGAWSVAGNLQERLASINTTNTTVKASRSDGFDTAHDKVDEIYDDWSWLKSNNDLTLKAKVEQSGSIPRATGGSVDAPQLYKVGERGTELFVPPMDGMILNHQATERVLRDFATARAAGGMVRGVQYHHNANWIGSAPRSYSEGGAYYDQRQTNFNLTIHSQATTEETVRGFQMMQTLVGG